METNENETRHNGPSHAQELGVDMGAVDPAQALAMVANVAREHPHAALLGACAVGFVLGGGLTPRLIGAVGLLLARRYFRQTVNETLDAVIRERAGVRPMEQP